MVPLLEERFLCRIAQREKGRHDGELLFGPTQELHFISAAKILPAVILAVVAGTML